MNTNPAHVVTGRARLSYCNLLEPRGSTFNPDADPKYSVTVLVPKSDTATMQRISAAIEAAATAGVTSKWSNQRPPMLKTPVHDGDGQRPSDGLPFGDECKGHWVFTAANTRKPDVVDAACNPIVSPTEIYSGMYGRVGIDFFPYNSGGSKGIGCSLCTVQKLEDGEPLGARSSTAAEDFGDGYGAQFSQPVPQAAPAAPRYNPMTGRYE